MKNITAEEFHKQEPLSFSRENCTKCKGVGLISAGEYCGHCRGIGYEPLKENNQK